MLCSYYSYYYYYYYYYNPSKTLPLSPSSTYMVVAPRLVRAGQVYRAVVNILAPSPALVVRATIFRDNIELAAVEHECESDFPHVLALMVSGKVSEE